MISLKPRSTKDKLLSIIVPCFNEEEVINETHKRLMESLNTQPFALEIIYVNDGSLDNTTQLLNYIVSNHECAKAIHFSRNFGHQPAVSAGLQHCSGDIVVIIDADLQDPPEVILEMVVRWEEGYDVVYGQREERLGETAFKLLSARYFYKLLNHLSTTDIPPNTGDFRLIDRCVVDIVNSMPEQNRFLRGIITWVGFNQTPVFYQRQERFAGTTKYSLRKMFNFATDGIISFSNKPLRLAAWLGVAISSLSVLGISYALGLRLLTNEWVSGWTFLIVAVLFMGGVQLLFLGLIGEYIGRVYQEAKGRPLYLIQETNGFDRAS
jgi:dolichol-phosphate mannosyltransferase